MRSVFIEWLLVKTVLLNCYLEFAEAVPPPTMSTPADPVDPLDLTGGFPDVLLEDAVELPSCGKNISTKR